MPRLFCFGLGYTARALARRLIAESWQVAGTTRAPDKQARLAVEGLQVHLFGRGRPLSDAAAALAGTTHLLTSIPPDEIGDPVLDHHLADLRGCATLRWAGYLGTTGVYGDRGGAWVSEENAVAPTMVRTRRRAAAEERWLHSGLPVHLFRLAGIYGPGPGRNALEAVRAGTARRIVKPGQVFGRVHVDDIVQVLCASIARPNPGAVYNVADDEPAPPQDVIAFACELLGVAPPPEVPYEEAELSPMARSFYADNRRIANARIKRELGVSLHYPSYRDGLRAILEQENQSDRLASATR
jgi:nucleoside-diphosphate-sugar epimerase